MVAETGPAAVADGLVKRYGEIAAVTDATFDVRHGEVLGFLGPNGAGKSTTIRMLLGLTRPTAGTARVLGARVDDRTAFRRTLGRVGYVPGGDGFYPDLRGRDLLNYFASLRGAPRRAELEERFPAPFDRRIDDYSRGNRQKLALVQAFMSDPDLVVMDEPTAGLDPLIQNRFYEFLDREREAGTTVLLSSHILSEVRRVCDRVVVIRDGRVVAAKGVEALLAESGRVVTADLTDPPALSAFDRSEVSHAEYLADGRLRLVCTGGYDTLLSTLSAHGVREIEIRESDLDDIFRHFYEGEQGGEQADRPDGAAEDESSTEADA